MRIKHRGRALGCALLVIATVGAALLAARPASADPGAPSGVDFGDIPFGTTPADRPITVLIATGYHLGGAYALPSAQISVDSGDCVAGATHSCTSHVHLDPNTFGPTTSSWHFDVCADGGTACDPGTSVPLRANVVSVLAATPGELDFGTVPIGTTVERELTVTPDVGHGAEFGKFDGDPGFGQDNGSCNLGKRPCTMTVSFHPTKFGPAATTLTLASCHNGECLALDVPLRASGSSTRSADPASVDFGNVAVGTTVERDLAITPDPGYHAELNDFDGDPAFGQDNDTCDLDERPCTMKVSVHPTTFGPLTTTMTLVSCRLDQCLPIKIPLRANGSSVLAATPAILDFGDGLIGTSVKRPVDFVLDAGYPPGGITVVNADNSPGTSVEIGNCVSENATGSCSMQVGATPSATGPQSVTLQVRECNARAVCRTIDVPIRTYGVTPLVVPAQTLPNGTIGTAYHTQLHADGGKGEPTWTVGTGQLPPGLSLDRNGVISGTPTAAGTSTLTGHVVDSSSLHQAGDVSLTLDVSAAPVPPSGLPSHPGSTAPGAPGSHAPPSPAQANPAPPQSPASPSNGSRDGLAFTGLLADPARVGGLAALLLIAGVALLSGARWSRSGRRR
jgi:hypothetical protein